MYSKIGNEGGGFNKKSRYMSYGQASHLSSILNHSNIYLILYVCLSGVCELNIACFFFGVNLLMCKTCVFLSEYIYIKLNSQLRRQDHRSHSAFLSAIHVTSERAMDMVAWSDVFLNNLCFTEYITMQSAYSANTLSTFVCTTRGSY